MNELATHFVRLLGQTTLTLTLAVIVIGAVLRGLRVSSPTAHRFGWTLALLTGWWFVRLSAQVPWYEPEAIVEAIAEPSIESGVVAEASSGPPLAPIDPALPGDSNRLLAQDALNGAVDDGGLIEIGPDAARAKAQIAPTAEIALPNDLVLSHAPLPAEIDLPIVAHRARPHSIEESTPAVPPQSQWPLAAVAVWGLGVGCIVIGWLLGYVRFVRRLPSARPAPEAWAEQWRSLQAARRLRRPIPLRVTENLGPMLCRLPRGYALLVPEALWRDLDAPQRAAVLRHELAHYLRRDVWKSLAVRALALPHWFNPMAWWAVRRFDDAAEWACDCAAAADETVTSYARTLVRLGESAARRAAYSPGARGASLSTRVRRLLSASSDKDSIVKKLALASLAIVAVAALAVRVELVAKERDEPANDKSNEVAADGSLAAPSSDAEQPAATPAEKPAETSADEPADKPAAAPDPLAVANAELVEAGERGFEAASASYNNDTITLDEVCAWSLRWLSAMEVTAKAPEDKVVAAKANLQRFEGLRDRVKVLYDMGVRGGEAEKMAMTDYYVADAKRRLAHAEREAVRAQQTLLKARDRAVAQDEKLQASKAQVEEVRRAEQRVKDAKKHLEEMTHIRDATYRSSRNVAECEAARLKAAEAEHELDQAVREVVKARGAFPTSTKVSAPAPEVEAPDIGATLEEQLRERLAAEEKLRQAKASFQETNRAQIAADRTGDAEKIAAAEADVAAAKQKAAEARREIHLLRGAILPADLMQEDAARNRLDQATLQVEVAKKNIEAAASLQKEIGASTSKEDVAFVAEKVGEANQALAVARREANAAQVAFQDHLRAWLEKREAEERAARLRFVQDKVYADDKVRRLEADIAEYDVAISKYQRLMKEGSKPNKTAENLIKERAGLQEKLQERVKLLEERFAESARGAWRSPETANGATVDQADRLARLRYNGRSFAEWKEQLETELSPERLAEACGAFAAFARSGYGAEAAGPIVDVVGNQSTASLKLGSPQLFLVSSAVQILIDLPIEYVLPALAESLDSPLRARRQFAIDVLSQRPDNPTAAIPILLKGAQDADSATSQQALRGLAKIDPEREEVLAAFRAALASDDPRIQIGAMRVIGGMPATEEANRQRATEIGQSRPPRVSPQFVPILIERLKDKNEATSLAALQALSQFGVENAPALPTILPWLKDEGSQRQTLALRIIRALGPLALKATPELIELADSGKAGEKEAIECLGAIGPPAKAAVPKLMEIANSRSNTGAAAVRALGRMGPAAAEAIPLLEKFATGDNWPHLREDALEALPYLRGEKKLSEREGATNKAPNPNNLIPKTPSKDRK
ncbi:MAG TPA: HEAT repeat domain-containing protein [Pirellulales bacterium]|jgi:beta-lactamase regulating signal transducer with metallopeptidase domain